MQPNVIVIGAGPAGLAAAATLQEHGIRPTVLERSGTVGSSWRGRWETLRLHTVRWLSGLPGATIPRRYGRWVVRDDLVRYLDDYAEQFAVQPVFGVTATRIDRTDGGWLVACEAGVGPTTYEADAVVVATGYSHTPSIPGWPGRSEFTRPLLHSSEYRSAADFAGRRVLVVGSGNSGADIAAELAGTAAEVLISIRTPPNIVRRATLGVPTQLVGVAMKRVPEPVMNPMSGLLRRLSVPDLSEHGLPAPADSFSQYLRTRTVPVIDFGFVDRVRSGQITVVAAVVGLEGEEVRLADGSSVQPDVVICATGYRQGLEGLVGHLGVLDDRGMPLVRGAETLPGAPGLHFVGLTIVLSGLMYEIGREARDVGRALAEPSGAAP